MHTLLAFLFSLLILCKYTYFIPVYFSFFIFNKLDNLINDLINVSKCMSQMSHNSIIHKVQLETSSNNGGQSSNNNDNRISSNSSNRIYSYNILIIVYICPKTTTISGQYDDKVDIITIFSLNSCPAICL